MPDPARRTFPAAPESVGRVRGFVDRTLTLWGVDGRADDVRLCVSELATNAVTHGTVPGHGFTVTVTAEDDAVCIEVGDPSPRRLRLRNPTNGDTVGRGLQLLGALSDEWGVTEHGMVGKTVWSRFKITPAPKKAPC
ncbi:MULTISPECIES: ATP-binding protein [Streptomyces]|uniref:ATP-binding protein n=2 Tax=Streptomyces rimosus subsp. rimosus TaxID=132474 RepID=L8EVY2_STRR1|nr:MULTISPECIES: ATP-binding protein [Streptomyces]KOG76546.1 6-phosphofructokinase [Kitasatospora aureofaciens]MYT48269.1 ATP-binding protein [Streptomyces sp. SID5471]KEF03560.1 6-phosphofructokinase [Streptomyces rimosus]KEF21250.1 6-phosphofructokinase [Streptomyces rimosus]KOT41251.1 6-phosphofructokinase [Streptomyces sp. NRRL WC-3701]